MCTSECLPDDKVRIVEELQRGNYVYGEGEGGVNGSDGLISLKIFAAITKSAKTGNKVKI